MKVRVNGLLWVRELIAHNHAAVVDDGAHAVECVFRCTPEAGATIGPSSVPNTGQIDVYWLPLTELPTIAMWPATVQQILIADPTRANAFIPAYLGDCR